MVNDRPKAVGLVAACPHCGEAVEIVLSKKEVKALFKGFKMPIRNAQVAMEREIERHG